MINLPLGAEQVGETTAQDLALVKLQKIRGVDYREAPLSVYETPQDDGSRFDIVIDHPPLNGEHLLGLLNAISPSYSQRLEGVIADWNVVDRTRDGNEAERLVELHKHMGGPWAEFMQSRRAFLDTLENSRGPNFTRYGMRTSPNLQSQTAIEERIERDVLGGFEATLDDVAELLTQLGADAEEARTDVFAAAKQEVNRKRNPNRQLERPEAIERRHRSWDTYRKRGFMKRLLEDTDEETRASYLAAYRDERYDFAELEDGSVFGYPRNLLDEPLQDIYAKRTKALDGQYEGEAITLPDDDGKLQQILVPGTIRRFTEGSRISPLIAWERDKTGKRSFVFERSFEADDDIHFRDGVLGAIAVAYFAPEIRKDWPDRMKIRGSAIEQRMGAAQIPVLALMRQAQLLKSDFVESIEALS